MINYRGLFIPLICIFLFGCISASRYSAIDLKERVTEYRDEIADSRNILLFIKKRKIGKSGFFYMIDSEGRILAHPKTYLIGSSFKKNKFIKTIIKNRSGCFQYDVAKSTYYIFYEPVDSNSILCLSVLKREVKDVSAHCTKKF